VRILLISGAVSGQKRYGKLEKAGAYLPPYGLLSIAACLEQAGHRVALLDREISPLADEDVVKRIQDEKPDLVGLSVFTIGCEESTALARAVKDAVDVPIVAGGPHVTIGFDYLKEERCFDYFVRGEGERTAVQLVQALDSGASVSEVPGLAFRRDGVLLENPPQTSITNLDDLPFPAFHLLEHLDQYHPTPFGYRRLPHVTLVTSRGCPFDCVFCSRLWGKKWRAHSAEYVVELTKYVVERFGAREVWFAEDTFTLNRERTAQICEGMLQAGLDIKWSCMTNVHVLDPELACLMKKAGCWQVQLGLESGNDEVLKFIRKPVSTQLIREQTNVIHDAGIKVRAYFILGHLIDTEETIRQTIGFALSLPLYTAEFHILHLPLGSEARTIAHDYGVVNCDLALLSGYTDAGLSFVPEGLTAEALFAFRREGTNRFFLRPRKLAEFALDIRSITDLRRYWLIAQAFLTSLRSG